MTATSPDYDALLADTEKQFADLQRRITEAREEQLRLQGEYRLLKRLQADNTPEATDVLPTA